MVWLMTGGHCDDCDGYDGAGVPFPDGGVRILHIGHIQMPSFWRMCVVVLGHGNAGPVKVSRTGDDGCGGGDQHSAVGWNSGKSNVTKETSYVHKTKELAVNKIKDYCVT